MGKFSFLFISKKVKDDKEEEVIYVYKDKYEKQYIEKVVLALMHVFLSFIFTKVIKDKALTVSPFSVLLELENCFNEFRSKYNLNIVALNNQDIDDLISNIKTIDDWNFFYNYLGDGHSNDGHSALNSHDLMFIMRCIFHLFIEYHCEFLDSSKINDIQYKITVFKTVILWLWSNGDSEDSDLSKLLKNVENLV